MRKIIASTWIMAAAVLSGCSNYDETMNPDTSAGGHTVSLYARMAGDDQTRAGITIDGTTFTGSWDTTDELGVFATAPAANAPELGKFTYDGTAFTGTLPAGDKGAWSYLAFYPHTTVAGTKVILPFGNSRIQQGSLFNSKYDALVAEAVACTNAEPGEDNAGSPVSFDLHRLTSILNFEIKGGGTSTDKVKAILLTSKNAAQPLSAATLEFDAANGAQAQAALGTEDRATVIALTYADGSAPAADDLNAFFNIPAGNYDELTFDVITETNLIGTASIRRDDAQNPFAAGKLHKYERSTALTLNALAAPSFNWPGRDLDATHEITTNEESELTYTAAIDITAPGGIAGLEVEITSGVLNQMGISKLDLVHEKEIPGLEIAYEDLKLKCGTDIQYHKSTTFDITTLVPMIKLLGDSYGNHIFTIKVTDLAGQTSTQDLTFSVTKPNGATYNGRANLWTNTAEMTVAPAAGSQSVKLEYRIQGEAAWNTAELGTADASGVYRHAQLQPSWSEGTNAAGQTIYTVDPKTGVFPLRTYEYQLTIDGSVTDSGVFTPAFDGNPIPAGDMEDAALPSFLIPTKTAPASNSSLTWGSGNNKVLSECWLCRQAEYASGKYANLTSTIQNTFIRGKVLAAGNLFMGQFTQNGKGGDVRFGQVYDWKARPTAMRVKYTAKVGTVDYMQNIEKIAKDQQDKARIFVAIIDWSERHTVTSTLNLGDNPATVTAIGSWDPVSGSDAVSEGKIIGYGSLEIGADTDWTTVEIPIQYYDKTAKPAAGNYSLAISCACNMYGEYFNGCSGNTLGVDDFEWVY